MSDESPSTAPFPALPAVPGPGSAAPGGAAGLQQLAARALESISEGFIILDRDWRFVYVNPAAERFTRKSGAELLGQSLWEIFPDAAHRRFGVEYRRAVADNVPVHFEAFYPEPLNARYEVRAYPSPEGLSILFTDVTERTLAEAYREMGREVLQRLNEPADLRASIQRVLAALKTGTGVDAVGIRLQAGDDFPYAVQEGFPEDFLLTEDTLAERGADGGVCRDRNGEVSLEGTCGLVISGRTDPANPLFTPGGSCWMNDSLALLDIPPEGDPRLHPRNLCIHRGYASVALVPIRNVDRVVGLIQLNDRRKGCFTLERIELLEGIGSQIGAALIRKQADAALRQSEERYRTILETAMDGFWLADAQGRLLEVNEAYCRMSGYSARELLAMRVPDLEAFETAEETAARIRAVIARGEDRFESRHRRKDGSTFDVEVSVQYWPGGDGRLIVFLRDLTRRKLAEEALRERVKEMDCLYSIGDLIDREDDLEKILHGTVERMPRGWQHSDIACARTTVDGQELKTANFRETAWRQAAEIVVHGRPAGTVELRYLEERPLRDEGPFLREERSLIDAIADRLGRAVERLQAEAALRESEARHRTILLTAMDGFWLVDLRGRLLEVNEAYCRMSGYGEQELLAMRIPDLEAVETPEQTAARIQALMTRGEERFESRHRRKDGSTFDVEVSVKYWAAGDGRFIVFLRDVSARKLAERHLDRARADVLMEKTRLEETARSLAESEAELLRANQRLEAANEALRCSNETLEARVAERTADLLRRTAQLQALAQDLTRAEERERQRVAQVIHDHLQQLLSLARMNLGMVLDRVRTRSVKQSLGSLDGLIAESLDLTRSLTAELSPAILHRSGLAAALWWLGRWYEERFGLKVAVDAEGDVEIGEELRVTMFRGVRELLFNVVKHANVANAGVQLRRAADGSTRVVVRDEGVGFDPERLRAWDGGPGHGFGLFSLRERLELLGGHLHVDSAPGQGASFTIIGPPLRPERPGTPSTPPAAPPKAATRKQTGRRRGDPARRRKR